MKKNKLITIIFFFISFYVKAYECSQNDKLPDWRSSLGPIRDQDSIGWCYAFTASDLLTDYLSKHPSNRSDKMSSANFTKKENMVSPFSGAVAVDNGVVNVSSSMSMGISDNKDFSYDALLKNNQKLKEANEKFGQICGINCKQDCLYAYTNKINYPDYCIDWVKSKEKEFIQLIDSYKLVEQLDHEQRDATSRFFRLTMGGNAELILQYYLKEGFSLESQFPTDNINNENWLRNLSYKIALNYGTALSKEEAICTNYNTFKEICPSCKDTLADMKAILEKGFDPSNSLLYEISSSDRFKLKVKNAEQIEVKNFSYTNNEDLEQKRKDIDKGLSTGIVGIGYDVHNIVSTNSGGHASSLVGKKCISGQEYYILRNSWGVQACESGKKKMTLEQIGAISKDSTQSDNVKNYSSCMDKCNDIVTTISSFSDFPMVDNKKVLEKEECKNSCYIANKEKLEMEFETYQCDEQGYYLIRSEKILKSVSSLQYLQGTEK